MRSNRVRGALGALCGVAALSVSLAAVPDASALPPVLPDVRPETRSAEDARLRFPGGMRHDFGTIWDTEPVEHEFEFVNASERPVEVTRVRSTCGCTISAVRDEMGRSLEEGERFFEPGAVGTIVATFDPARRSGEQRKPVYIHLNGSARPNYTLQVVSDVKQVVGVEPRNVAFTGVGRFEEARPSEEITITGRSESFDVTVPERFSSEVVRVERVGAESVEFDGEPGRAVTFRVTLRDDVKPGAMRQTVTLQTTDERRPTIAIPVAARVMGDLSTQPRRVNLGRLEPGEAYRHSFVVSSGSQRPFSIEDVEVSGPLSKAEVTWSPVEEGSKDAYEVVISGKAGREARQLGRISVKTTLEDEPNLTVPYLGWVRAADVGRGVRP